MLARDEPIRDSPRMSLAEIKAELPKLTPAERTALARALEALRTLDDPVFVAELSMRMDEMERGINVVTSDEMYARLRAAGHDV